MGLLDFITKAQEKINDFQNRVNNALNIQAAENPAEILNSLKPTPKQSRTAKRIIDRFYFDYPETPYISNDRQKDWIERAEMFPKQCIIPKSIMTRYADGLLPGHIYMLYWLKKYTNKKVPVYFEYKYGVDFEKEKIYLHENGFLDDANKPTEKGEAAITQHFEVIENHKIATEKPAPTIENISAQIIAQLNSIKRNGFSQYEFIANSGCCEVCGKLNEKHFSISKFEIGVNAPPMHEGCRCSISAYAGREEYEKWLNSF